ncbi:hypothetical protein DR864_11280 [Runella rosea]|uniref:BBC1/AIM3 cysteine proteinase-fold domain-containing protein n=1 Tax=Runella rosea TaxID=2259595 RepID=A0A344TI14_9BACT|nr:hypothetical protein [Runella rosea]AXE18285.1 hypothetical protein DR864_11280 [Runella rosea]
METCDIANDLEQYGSLKNGSKVVIDKKKDEGSCWEFVEMALREKGYQNHEKGGLGDLYVWGAPVDERLIKTGDILQFYKHEYKLKNGTRSKRGPLHTAIVSSYNDDRSIVRVWEQHVTKPSRVVRNKVYLKATGDCEEVIGEVKAFRPVKRLR